MGHTAFIFQNSILTIVPMVYTSYKYNYIIYNTKKNHFV